MKNYREKFSDKRKKDKISIICAAALFIVAIALFIVAFVLFQSGDFRPNHSRYFTACLLLACGGVCALCSAACLFFSPLVQDKRRRVPPFCDTGESEKDDDCGGCGKRSR